MDYKPFGPVYLFDNYLFEDPFFNKKALFFTEGFSTIDQ